MRMGRWVIAVVAALGVVGCYVTSAPVAVAYAPANAGAQATAQPAVVQPTVSQSSPPPSVVVVPAPAPGGATQCVPGPTQAATVRDVDWQNCTYSATFQPGAPLGSGGSATVREGHYECPIVVGPYEEAGPYVFDIVSVSYGDVTGDGVEDALVYTMEGGYEQHGCDETRIATLWSVIGGALVDLGKITQEGREFDCFDQAVIQDGAVAVRRAVWSSADPACCPSEQRAERWVWTGGELAEDVSARQPETCEPTGNCGWYDASLVTAP